MAAYEPPILPLAVWMSRALDILSTSKSLVTATVVSPPDHPWIGGRILIGKDDPDFGFNPSLRPGDLESWKKIVTEVMTDRNARLKNVVLVPANPGAIGSADTTVEMFFAPFAPSSEACIFGAGHIAVELAPVLHALNWRIVVCDDRSEFVNKTRFPMAGQLQCLGFHLSAHICTKNPESWAVLITRGHEHDEQILRVLLGAPNLPRYIGMIGSKRRVATVRRRLESEGIPRDRLDFVHAPIGLPIGADTPAEIALSIAAEMVAVRRGHRRDPATGNLQPIEGFRRTQADTASLPDLWYDVKTNIQMGKPVAFATIIDRRGSAPRGIGAQMAVFADGTTMGSIGGGCGEAVVLQEAQRLLLGGRNPGKIEVDLTGDDAAEAGDVCGGHYTVFLETLPPQ